MTNRDYIKGFKAGIKRGEIRAFKRFRDFSKGMIAKLKKREEKGKNDTH